VHVSTTRRLRADELFDNLIQKLSCIIEESTDDSDDIDLKILLDSLKALLWHFQCPICSNKLEDTQISSECLHRFCRSCISSDICRTMPQCSSALAVATTSSTLPSGTGTGTDSGPVAALSRHPGKCPFCVNQDQTVFFADKQYESINKAIRYIIETIENANGDNLLEVTGDEVISEQSGEFRLLENAHEMDSNIENEFSNSSWGANDEIFNREDPFSAEGFDFDSEELDAALPDNVASELPPSEILNQVESTTMASDGGVGNDGSKGEANSRQLPTLEKQAKSAHTTLTKTVRFDSNIPTLDQGGEMPPPKPIKQRYKTGSRFVQTDSEKYGRILGFGEGYYQVFFPHDKSCHNYTEQDFSLVKFIKPHKRPTQTPKAQNQDRGDSVLCCPRCKSRFSSNPDDDVSGRAPVQSQNCAHVICVDCVQNIRMASLPKNSGNNNRKLRVTVDCPFCKKSKSFNAVDPTICVAMCQMVSLYEQMEHQKKEDKIRRKIKEEEDREKHNSKKSPSSKRKQTPGTEKKNQKERKKARSGGEATGKRSTPHVHKKSSHFKCKVCKQEKVVEKFSSKQLEKVKQKSRPVCRRCEEKGILRKQLGVGSDKVSTTIKVAKKHGSKPKFLTTIVPWYDGKAITDSTPLPSDLTIDGYTRDPWGLFEGNNTEEDKCWIRCSFWSSGNGMAPFIKFLQENKKSAYGTFVTDQTDGFFVIPFDQPTPLKTSQPNIFQCKYITGLGLVGEPSTSEPVAQTTNYPADPNENVQREQKSGSLRNLLAAEYKTSQSLSVVPKGSVKAAKKISSRPEGPAPSLGPTNWYRQRIVIREEGEGNSSDDGAETNKADDTIKADNSNHPAQFEL